MYQVEIQFRNGIKQIAYVKNTQHHTTVFLDSYYASRERIENITWRKLHA